MKKGKAPKSILRADEGMWPLNAVPKSRVKKLHNIDLTDKWLTHVQRASVRMNNGGSASFVSPDGLLVTNHHVAASVLYELSSAKRDYMATGFLAQTRAKEVKAPQLEVNVLWEIEDVTEQVKNAVSKEKSAKARALKRRAVIAKIEKDSKEASGLRSDVVALYNGGKYHLYRYKRYTDVRLVFAPESAIASFGGDIDNYEYPRYSLDCAFFRVYEKGKPLKTPYHFSWSTKTPTMGETLFVSGHPGTTDRLTTYDRLLYLRNTSMPKALDYIRRIEVLLQQYSGRSPEHARRAKDDLHSFQNVRKRYVGQLASIQEPGFFKDLKEREENIRAEISKQPALKKSVGDAWGDIRKATEYLGKHRDEYLMFERGRGFSCELFSIARTIVRLVAEDKKPNAKRLEEYGEARRESLLESLFSPAPVYNDLEETRFTEALRILVETLGYEDAAVQAVLNGKSVEEVAKSYIRTSKLGSVSYRKSLVNGGAAAVAASKDPFILLAREVDARSRKIREAMETHVEEPTEDAYDRIVGALFAIYGESLYPDATFTLRLAYGSIQPYKLEQVPEQRYTTIGGVFAHGELHDSEGAWKLPESWEKKKAVLKKDKSAFNFITTHDSHGGNSGSPVFNKHLKIVGLLFDGVTHTQGDTFMYMSSTTDHTVSVHTQGIYSVLKSVYGAKALIKELIG